jgi:hypothetical protein
MSMGGAMLIAGRDPGLIYHHLLRLAQQTGAMPVDNIFGQEYLLLFNLDITTPTVQASFFPDPSDSKAL